LEDSFTKPKIEGGTITKAIRFDH